MSIFEFRSRQTSQTLAWSRFQDSRLGRECRLLVTLLILAAIATTIVTDQTWAQLYEGEEVVTVTNAYWVRLRSTPEINPDTILTRVAGGAQLRCLEVQDEWFKVQLSNGSEGWLNSEFGRLDSARDQLRVSASVARIRETPDPGAPVVGRAIQGLMLEIIEKDDQWYSVRLPLGEEGWVREDLVKLHAVEPKPQQTELSPAEQVESGGRLAADLKETADDQGGTRLLEMTPLPISANASSGEEESSASAPTLRSPQGIDKPTFLMLFVSVIAGLAAFAVILVVGAVAMRRRKQQEEQVEPADADSVSPSTEATSKEYTDPLLKWVPEPPHKFEGNGKDHTETDQEELEPPGRSEPFPISIRKEETSSSEAEVEDSSDSFDPKQETEEKPLDSSLQELWLKDLEIEEEPTEQSESPDKSEPVPFSVREEDPYSPPAEPKDSSLSLEFDLEPEEASVVGAFQEQWTETLAPQEEIQQEQELRTESEPFPISVRQDPPPSTQEEPSERVETKSSTVRIYPVADERETETALPSADATVTLPAVTAVKESQSAEPGQKKTKTRSSHARSRKKAKRGGDARADALQYPIFNDQ